MEEKGYLILEDGTVFQGVPFGAAEETVGEVVFTTAMTGYLETLTDPSYYGQIVVQTFPLIGNYGVIPADFESGAPRLRGYIVREWCQEPSNFRCAGGLDAFLKEKGIVGLSDIDTRALTRIVREHGVMNGRISRSPYLTHEEQEAVWAYRVTGAVRAVSCHAPEVLLPKETPLCHVVLWDFGAKAGIRRELLKRGCRVITAPARTTAIEILAQHPDGVMLTNGEVQRLLMGDMVSSLLFVALGIAVTWNQISRTARSSMDDALAIQQSAMVNPLAGQDANRY